MSSEIDRFVLQYKVDLSDAIARLEKLNGKVKEVNKNGGDFSGKMKQGIGELTNAFGSLDSTLASVATRFGAIGTVLGAVGATVAFVAKGIKDINSMNALSYKTGIGATSMESIQRNLMRNGGGLISRDQAQDALQKNRDFWQRARINPGGLESVAASRMGLNPSTMTPSAFLSGTAAWMKANPGAKGALAIGGQIGYTPQMINAMAAAGSGVTANALSPEAMAEHKKAQEAAAHVTKFLGDMNEELSKFTFENADKLINFLTKLNDAIPNGTMGKLWDSIEGAINPLSGARKLVSGASDAVKKIGGQDLTPQQLELKAKEESIAKAAAEKAQADVEAEDAAAAAKAEDTATWQQMLAQFSGSVNKFTNSIDVQQAWAAWAGEIGRAAGLSGSSPKQDLSGNSASYKPSGMGLLGGASNGSTVARNNPGNIRWKNGGFAAAHGATGGEGGFAVFPDLATGEAAMHTLLSGPSYAGGDHNTIAKIVSKWAPPSDHNNTAGYISFVAKKTGLDPNKPLTDADINAVQGAMMQMETGYRGGSAGSGGLPASLKTEAVDPNARGSWDFSGEKFVRGKGESLDTVRQRSLATALASDMGHGMKAAQILSGNVSKADLNWAASNMMSSLVNSRQALNNKLKVPMLDLERNQTIADLRDTDNNILNLQNYMPSLAANAQPGGRQITIGEQRIIVNAGATTDPQQLAIEIRKEIDMWERRTVDAMVNEHADGRVN
jgi:hypothetical protein